MERFVVVPQFTVDAFMALPEDTVGMAPNIITSRFEHILKKTGLVQTSGTTMHLYSMHSVSLMPTSCRQADGETTKF